MWCVLANQHQIEIIDNNSKIQWILNGYHFNKKARPTKLWILIPIEFFLTTINPIGFPYSFKSKNNLLLNEISQNSIKCTCGIGISMKLVVAYLNFSKLALHFGSIGLPTCWSEKSTWASCGVNLDFYFFCSVMIIPSLHPCIWTSNPLGAKPKNM
jgi:hypothetical protein